MPDPVNYLAQLQPVAPINPLQSFTQGLGVGQSFAQQRLANEQQRMAVEQAKAKAAQQAQLGEAITRIKSPDRTIEDFDNYDLLVTGMYSPEQSKAMREVTSGMKAEEVQSALASDMQVYSALMNGEKELAAKYLRDQAKAAENAGEPDIAAIVNEWATNVEGGGSRADAIAGMYAHKIMVTPGGRDAMKNAIEYAKERRDAAAEPTVQLKRLADIGLTEAQAKKVLAETKILDQDLIKMTGELEAAKESGGLDPEKKFTSELALNKEYETRTRAYNESLRLNSVIKDSAAANTGAGDLALINTFMKMLDPGSVVRESEFAQAQDTAGLVSKLAASLGRVQSGQVLVPAQRQEFARLADQYMTAAGVHEKKVRDSLGFIVKSYGLNEKNVFGTMADGATTTPAAATGKTGTTGATAAPKAAQPTTEVDY